MSVSSSEICIVDCPSIFPFHKLSGLSSFEYIASGSYGSVYKCLWKGKMVAIKLCEYEVGKNSNSTLDREWEMLGKVQGLDCVPELYKYGRTRIQETDFLFILMSFIEGRTITRIILEKKETSEQEKILLFRNLFSALLEIQERNMDQCDLNTGNVIVGKDMKCTIVDFGEAQEFSCENSAWEAALLCFEVATNKHSYGIGQEEYRKLAPSFFPEVLLECLESEECFSYKRVLERL